MFKKIAIGVVVLLLIVLGLAAMQPDSFRVQRAIAIKAPPEKILPLISDFHNWPQWLPWGDRQHGAAEQGRHQPGVMIGKDFDVGLSSMKAAAEK